MININNKFLTGIFKNNREIAKVLFNNSIIYQKKKLEVYWNESFHGGVYTDHETTSHWPVDITITPVYKSSATSETGAPVYVCPIHVTDYLIPYNKTSVTVSELSRGGFNFQYELRCSYLNVVPDASNSWIKEGYMTTIGRNSSANTPNSHFSNYMTGTNRPAGNPTYSWEAWSIWCDYSDFGSTITANQKFSFTHGFSIVRSGTVIAEIVVPCEITAAIDPTVPFDLSWNTPSYPIGIDAYVSGHQYDYAADLSSTPITKTSESGDFGVPVYKGTANVVAHIIPSSGSMPTSEADATGINFHFDIACSDSTAETNGSSKWLGEVGQTRLPHDSLWSYLITGVIQRTDPLPWNVENVARMYGNLFIYYNEFGDTLDDGDHINFDFGFLIKNGSTNVAEVIITVDITLTK